jgi:hypothetical protein
MCLNEQDADFLLELLDRAVRKVLAPAFISGQAQLRWSVAI